MKAILTRWTLEFFRVKHPASEPRKKAAVKRKKQLRHPASPSPESNNLRGRADERRITQAP